MYFNKYKGIVSTREKRACVIIIIMNGFRARRQRRRAERSRLKRKRAKCGTKKKHVSECYRHT